MKSKSSCVEGQPNLAVRTIASFPIPLDGFFKTWDKEKTLKPRLRAALAVACQIHNGEVVAYGSIIDKTIEAFLNEILP